VLRDIAYISYLTETKTPGGPWWELAVIHHTDCGSTLLADPEVRRGFAARGGYVEAELAWLVGADNSVTAADLVSLCRTRSLELGIWLRECFMFRHCQYLWHYGSLISRYCVCSAGSPCSPGPAGPRKPRS
jgi:hypothetical protein